MTQATGLIVVFDGAVTRSAPNDKILEIPVARPIQFDFDFSEFSVKIPLRFINNQILVAQQLSQVAKCLFQLDHRAGEKEPSSGLFSQSTHLFVFSIHYLSGFDTEKSTC